MSEPFSPHPDAEIYLSQPGIGPSPAPGSSPSSGTHPAATPPPRPARTTPAPAPSPAQSGSSKCPAPGTSATTGSPTPCNPRRFSALTASPGARAYYDRQRARGLGHNAALRRVSNRLVGILHGCLKTRTRYNEATAWPNAVAYTEPLAA